MYTDSVIDVFYHGVTTYWHFKNKTVCVLEDYAHHSSPLMIHSREKEVL